MTVATVFQSTLNMSMFNQDFNYIFNDHLRYKHKVSWCKQAKLKQSAFN